MLKKISYFFVMITFCFITCSCSKDDDRSSDIDDTTNTEGTNYSPSSIIGKTFCPGSEESIVAFTNSTSCSMPNYEMPSEYAWNEHPTYAYSYVTSQTATIIINFAIISSGSGYSVTSYNTYTYNLVFNKKKAGKFSAIHYTKWKTRILTSISYETTTKSFSGSFTLQ